MDPFKIDRLLSNQNILSNRVMYLTQAYRFEQIEATYINVRNRESRLYSDEVIKSLPFIKKTHPLHREWRIRQNSFGKLFSFI